MNKRPVSYLQKDPRWRDKPYRVPGEASTVGSAGCGPSCAAMVIETLTRAGIARPQGSNGAAQEPGRTYTPEDACRWSVDHGYKALRQGTYYSYFKPQLAAFGIDCGQLGGGSAYGNPDHPNHKRALELLKEGYYLIACMGKGNWTSTGHFILVWWADDIDSALAESNRAWPLDGAIARSIHINDPNSTRADRVQGDPDEFFRQVKYYWWVDARKYNNEEDIMTGKEIYDALQSYLAEQPAPDWARGELEEAKRLGITDGSRPMQLIPRYQAAIMAKRAAER